MVRWKAWSLTLFAELCASSLHNTCHNALPAPFPSLVEACRGAGGLLYSTGAPGLDTPVGWHPKSCTLNPSTRWPTLHKAVFGALPVSKARVSTCAYLLPWFVISEVLLFHSFRNEKYHLPAESSGYMSYWWASRHVPSEYVEQLVF